MPTESPTNIGSAGQVGFRTQKTASSVPPRNQPPVAPQAKPARNHATAPSAALKRAAPPLPKREKGRFFVGTIFVSILAFAAYSVWSAFFQYQSYGIIDGRVIAVSAPWNGVVANWQIKEGDEVVQGQALAEISNLELRYKLDSLVDELRLKQASLNSETTKLRFQAQQQITESEHALAEYMESAGNLESERAKAEELNHRHSRAKRLVKSGNMSRSQYNKLHFELVGHNRKIERMEIAVNALKKRYELSKRQQQEDLNLQIEPLFASIDSIQSEISRLRKKIQLGLLTAPANGRVTKRMALTGESVQLGESVIEIMESDSTTATLYVPQKNIRDFHVGSTLAVELPPYDEKLHCEVIRLGEKLEHAPKSIERFYMPNCVLLPVYLKPLPEYEQFMSLRINGTIKLPFNLTNRLQKSTLSAYHKVVGYFSNKKQRSIKVVTSNHSADTTLQLGLSDVH